jgi:uncharacterized membrane protein
MLWLLTVHLGALIVWCAMLLYLPALVAAAGDGAAPGAALAREPIALARPLFNLVATPAALLAIISGTGLFLLGQIVGVWLVLKLSAVSGMVVCHVLCGALIMRRERQPRASVVAPSGALGVLAALLMAGVLWLVLAKPFQ